MHVHMQAHAAAHMHAYMCRPILHPRSFNVNHSLYTGCMLGFRLTANKMFYCLTNQCASRTYTTNGALKILIGEFRQILAICGYTLCIRESHFIENFDSSANTKATLECDQNYSWKPHRSLINCIFQCCSLLISFLAIEWITVFCLNTWSDLFV